MLCWMICPSFKLLASSHEDILRVNQSEEEVVRTLDSSSVLQKGHNKLLPLPLLLLLIIIIMIYKNPTLGHAWINLVHSARLSHLQRADGQSAPSRTVWGIISHWYPSGTSSLSPRLLSDWLITLKLRVTTEAYFTFTYLLLFHEICNNCSTAICMSCLFEWNRINRAQFEPLGVELIGFEVNCHTFRDNFGT